jgi:hypothetical protein
MSSTQTTKMNQTQSQKTVEVKTKTASPSKAAKPEKLVTYYNFDHEDSDPDVQRYYKYKSTRPPCYYDYDSEPEDPP